MRKRIWEQYLDERDQKVYSGAGLGKVNGLGENPALVIIDVTYGFTGEESEDIEQSIKKYPTSCGADAWKAIPHIKELLNVCREVNIPIFYTIIEGHKHNSNEKTAIKGNVFGHPTLVEGGKGTEIVQQLKPIPGEIVISKKKPSAFFGTPLISYLVDQNVDTLIVTGTTTSGCVRASVVDAFSYNFNVVVPEECVFDRGITTHAMNLFDMQQKYADVLSTDEVIISLKKKIQHA
ncbi:isochorismatase family protein [Bacillus sp. S3]|uniref:isochorismatase family protein n=1 Tax=Bacillus sp. S3 TaxID=486398 RepID=UPI001CC21919|nr:isochorismatase family protein [Bacillus sp. S3]